MGAPVDVVISTFAVALTLGRWFLPWHVSTLRFLRLRWTDTFHRICASVTVPVLVFVPGGVIQHDWRGIVVDALMGGSAGYALWRAWREHRPPRRRLRDKAAAAVRALVERMQPARAPIPVRAFGGA